MNKNKQNKINNEKKNRVKTKYVLKIISSSKYSHPN